MEKLTRKKIFDEVLDKNYCLIEIQNDENLNEHVQVIGEFIREGESALYEMTNYLWDQELDNLAYLINEIIIPDIVTVFDVSKEEAKEFVDDNIEEIEDEIRKRDISRPIFDLLRHTDNTIIAMPLNYEIQDEPCFLSDEEIDEHFKNIKNILQLKNTKYDKTIKSIIHNASYGGELTAFFKFDLEHFSENRHLYEEASEITIKNANIGILDSFNGSGDFEAFDCDIKIPFNIKNLILDRELNYGMQEIFGMSDDWCDNSSYDLTKFEKEEKSEENEEIKNQIKEKNKFQKVFKQGGCSFGDMDITRHRNTQYINEFPCGTKCKDCGTFWVD